LTTRIHFDPKERRILGDPEADKLWGREYRLAKCPAAAGYIG
jgi:hypothetical protein